MQDAVIARREFTVMARIIWISFLPDVKDANTVPLDYGRRYGNSLQWHKKADTRADMTGPVLAKGNGSMEMLLPFGIPAMPPIEDPTWQRPTHTVRESAGRAPGSNIEKFNLYDVPNPTAKARMIQQSFLDVCCGKLIGRGGRELLVSSPIYSMTALHVGQCTNAREKSATLFMGHADQFGKLPVLAVDMKNGRGYILGGQFF